MKRNLSRQRKDQIRRIRKGLCALCEHKRVNRTHCDFHRLEYNERQRARQRARAALRNFEEENNGK